ncbi:MAG: FlgD immunoglobulin-like domain containing protein [Candidatus Eiseniibacteriota bacterium]
MKPRRRPSDMPPSAVPTQLACLLALVLILTIPAGRAAADEHVTLYDFEDNATRSLFQNQVEVSMNGGTTPLTRAGNTTAIGSGPGFGSSHPGLAITGTDWQVSAVDPGVGATDYFEFTTSTEGFGNIDVAFSFEQFADGPKLIGLAYSTNGGATFTAPGAIDVSAMGAVSPLLFDLSGDPAVNNQSSLIVRIYACSGSNGSFTSAGSLKIDNLALVAGEMLPNAGSRTLIPATHLSRSYNGLLDTEASPFVLLWGGSFIVRGPGSVVTIQGTTLVDFTSGQFEVEGGSTVRFTFHTQPNGVATGGNVRGNEFILHSGATIEIADAAGITLAPATTGNVRTSLRTFDSDANYVYARKVSATQATGTGLPPTLTGTLTVRRDSLSTDPLVVTNGGSSFQDVRLEAGSINPDFGVNGTLTMAGGSIAGTPGYDPSSTVLRYETPGTTGPEWPNGTNVPYVSIAPGAVVAIAGDALPRTVSRGLSIESGGSLTLGASDLTLLGDLTVAGGLNPTARNVSFLGSVPQVVTGATSLDEVTINNAAGVSLATGSMGVAGPLHLQTGVLSTGSNCVVLGPSGFVLPGAGYIDGCERIAAAAGGGLFHIGSGGSSTPVAVNLHNEIIPGSMTARSTAGDHPDAAASGINPSQSVNHWYSVTSSGAVFDSYDISLGFSPGSIDPGADHATFVVMKKDGGVWSSTTTGTRSNVHTQATGLTTFSEFVVGEPAVTTTWTITASAGAGGTIAPLGPVVVADGDDQSFTITPNSGFAIADVVVDLVSIGPVTNYTFTNVTADHTISASFVVAPRTLTWASTSSIAWETPGNWYDEVAGVPALTAPTNIDFCTVNGSRGATVSPTVTAGGQACARLTVGSGFTLRIAGTASPALTVGNATTGDNDITIQSGGAIRHESAAGSGNPFALASSTLDMFRIDDGGYYLHNTPRSFATPFPVAACSFANNSTFEYGQAFPGAIAAANRTYGNLHLSATGPKIFTATFGAASSFTVNGEFNLTSSFVTMNFALTSSAICRITRIRNQGGTLNFGTSTMPLVIIGTIVNNGTLTTSATQSITFDGSTDYSGSAVFWSNGFTVSDGRLLAVNGPMDWPAGTGVVAGTLEIRSLGSVGTAPTYVGFGLLELNPGGPRNVGPEWSVGTVSDPWTPKRVHVRSGANELPAGSRAVELDLRLLGGSLGMPAASSSELHVSGNWTASGGTFLHREQTVVFDGTTLGQQIHLSTPHSFGKVTIALSGPATVTSFDDVVVEELLTLTSGRIITASGAVFLLPGASVIRTAGHVEGNLSLPVSSGPSISKLYDLGLGGTWTPVLVTFDNVSVDGALLISSNFDGDHPSIGTSGIDASKSVNMYWSFTNFGVEFDQYDLSLHFAPVAIDAGADPLAFVIRKFDGGTWTRPEVTGRTATSLQAADLTSFSDFILGEAVDHTITASAGPNGLIAPSGAVLVADGDDQSFVITPDGGYVVSDLVVDAVSLGPMAGYTFNEVITDHTISVSFVAAASPNTIAAESPSGCVSIPNPCRTVPVTITRTDLTAVRAYSVTIQLSSDLELCSTPSASITQGSYLNSIGTTSFLVIANGGGSYTVDCAILGAPCGATAASGTLFNVAVKKATGGSDGTGTVSIGAVVLRDCPNSPLAVAAGGSASVPIDTSAPAALADVTSAQVTSGNDGDGTTKVTATWSGAEGGSSVAVYRKGFGSYPEYDDAGGAVPSAPATPAAALGDGWALTGLTASGQQDEPPARDFWYYVAFLTDGCGNVSAVSNVTSGSLNYHLGDVSDGFTPGSGNNLVGSEDLSLLGANYGISGGSVAAVAYLDVGPTTDFSTSARPTTDNAIQFEDLVVFAINFGEVSAPGVIADAPTSVPGAGTDEVSFEAAGVAAPGAEIAARIHLSGSGRVQALSVPMRWNANVVEPVDVEASAGLTAAGGVAFSPAAGTVDAALLGVRETGFAGELDLATVRFRVKRAGDPAFALGEVVARDARNRPIALGVAAGAHAVRASRTALLGAAPNPFRSATMFTYGLVVSGPVEFSIYTVGGRLVKTLVSGPRDAGIHTETWDGSDESGRRMPAGVYYAAFKGAGGPRESRTVTLIDR